MNATDMRDELLAAWATANGAYLDGQLRRMRLLLKRRALWLRGRWRQDPLQEYRGLLVSDTQADQLFSDGRADERRFYADDPEAAAIGEELAALERELDARAEGNGSAPPAVELLASLFGLSRFERDVILLCLAPELDPSFERIYAYVQDDNARTYPCAHLAVALFAGQGEAKAETSFGPQSALLRFGLVVVEPPPHPGAALAARPLRLPPRLVEYACGTNHIDESVAGLVRPVSAAPLSPAHTDLVERLERALERNPARRPGVNLVGPPRCGKRAVARGLCERLGLQLLAVDSAQIPPSGPAREECSSFSSAKALLRLAFTGRASGRAHPPAVASFEDLIDRLRPFVIVGSERRLASRRYLPAAVPAPGTREQRSLWNDALTSAGVSPRPVTEALAQQFHFGPAAIVGAVGAARARAALRGTGPEGVGDSDLWDAGRESWLASDELHTASRRGRAGTTSSCRTTCWASSRDRRPGGDRARSTTLGLRRSSARPRHQRPVRGSERHGQDDGRRDPGRPARARPLSHRSGRASCTSTSARPRRTFAGLRRRRAERRDPVLRRGGRAVREAHAR